MGEFVVGYGVLNNLAIRLKYNSMAAKSYRRTTCASPSFRGIGWVVPLIKQYQVKSVLGKALRIVRSIEAR
jgi:hypothetical protein